MLELVLTRRGWVGARGSYVSELRRFVDVDVYGGCGRLRCVGDDRCVAMLERRYYFYLAFENSLCADYITEKYWRTLRRDVVAVVLGAADYSRAIVAPTPALQVKLQVGQQVVSWSVDVVGTGQGRSRRSGRPGRGLTTFSATKVFSILCLLKS